MQKKILKMPLCWDRLPRIALVSVSASWISTLHLRFGFKVKSLVWICYLLSASLYVTTDCLSDQIIVSSSLRLKNLLFTASPSTYATSLFPRVDLSGNLGTHVWVQCPLLILRRLVGFIRELWLPFWLFQTFAWAIAVLTPTSIFLRINLLNCSLCPPEVLVWLVTLMAQGEHWEVTKTDHKENTETKLWRNELKK